MAIKGSGASKSTVKKISEFVTPLVEELGYFVWDLEYLKEGPTRILRLTIDSEDGITIDDCEKVSRAVSDLLDERDPIEESYTFQVSSPGIERELKTAMHVEACEGWDVEVRFYAPMAELGGIKCLSGVLGGYDDDGRIVIYTGERTPYSEDATEEESFELVALDPEKIAGIKTVYDFDF